MVFCGANLSAQDDDKLKDAEGCKDSPLIARFPGSIINSCDNKEYEQADLPLGGDKVKHIEGDYHYWDIGTRQAVVAWLVAHGATASRLTAKGLGQTMPVANNSTPDGRAKNRRVELVKQ